MMMGVMLNFFNQGWVGAVIGIVGVLIAIYTYKRSAIGPRLVYQWKSLKIIGKNEKTPDEIEIFYKGIKVPRIIKTQIIVWNSGNKTIDGVSIVRNDPLRFEFSESEEIISASILKTTKEVNKCEIIQSIDENGENTLFLHFDYLDPQDGVCIEILHTDINRYPEFLGSIKGIPKGPLYWGNKSKTRQGNSSKARSFILTAANFINKPLFKYLVLIAGLAMIAFSALPYISYETALNITKSKENLKSIFLQFFILGILYSSLPIPFLWSSRKRYPKMLDPDRLENEFTNHIGMAEMWQENGRI